LNYYTYDSRATYLLLPKQVGARGFPAQSDRGLVQMPWIGGIRRKRVVKRLTEAAETASCWL